MKQEHASWMHKVPKINWYKESWDKNGRWYNFISNKNITITDGLSRCYHIIHTGLGTLKVVKTKKQANHFVQRYMRSHPRG